MPFMSSACPPAAHRPLHIAAAVDQADACTAAPFVRLARLAERGGLDFVTLGDSFARRRPDALAVLSRVAPVTGRVGLVPTVTATHADPFQVQAAVATLDRVSHGRGGWAVDVSATEAALFGRRRAASRDALWREAGEVVDAARRLWDGGEDDAGTRAVATGRFLGRDEPRHVDFEGATFAVRGPSAVPRPPQGHPVVVVDATAGPAREMAARHADVALVRAASPEQAGAARDELRRSAAALGRDPAELRVFAALVVDLGGGEHAAQPGHGGGPLPTADGPLYRGGPVDLADLVAAWHAAGAADGFHLTPVEPLRDLERLVNATVALLQHRGLFRTFYPGATLREHLGLARPAHRYAAHTHAHAEEAR
ncbi:LLM class flavin-dependent oxidoreductase [Streptomyces longispororuber]|uniref:LLM class flavin-dependent oxidoreductase n=1 Tax=Streptomyces longispororuber TaxID=68230 RepID=UPI0037010B51